VQRPICQQLFVADGGPNPGAEGMEFVLTHPRHQRIGLLSVPADERQQLRVIWRLDVDQAIVPQCGEGLGLVMVDVVLQLDAAKVALGAARRVGGAQDRQDAPLEDLGRRDLRRAGLLAGR
jgi:hypothetical protein